MFKDLVKFNRSYRGFDESKTFTREELIEYVDHARLTPSSVNTQPFRYYIANEKEVVDRIQPLTGWARALPDLNLPYEGKRPTAFIIVCQDKNISEAIPRFAKDVGIVSQTILLAAAEKNIGGCMIGNFSPDKVSQELNLAENIAPVLIIALGKPDETIILKEISEGDDIKYYRDENDVHYVPKRKLEDIIL
ncbi:MAG: nitroreductase family protein [Clostridia bacterium]